MILEKHIKSSKEGKIALSNTLVETATKLNNCPIKVTCDDYPGEEAVYQVTDLLKPHHKIGPFPNQFGEGVYFLYVYVWKGESKTETPVEETSIIVNEDSEPDNCTEKTIVKKGKNYLVRTPVVITTYEDKEVTLFEFVGASIRKLRTAKGLTQNQLASLTETKVSGSSISQIETGLTNPYLSSLEYLAEALDVHITDLFPPKE